MESHQLQKHPSEFHVLKHQIAINPDGDHDHDHEDEDDLPAVDEDVGARVEDEGEVGD